MTSFTCKLPKSCKCKHIFVFHCLMPYRQYMLLCLEQGDSQFQQRVSPSMQLSGSKCIFPFFVNYSKTYLLICICSFLEPWFQKFLIFSGNQQIMFLLLLRAVSICMQMNTLTNIPCLEQKFCVRTYPPPNFTPSLSKSKFNAPLWECAHPLGRIPLGWDNISHKPSESRNTVPNLPPSAASQHA